MNLILSRLTRISMNATVLYVCELIGYAHYHIDVCLEDNREDY